jgi:hypothetical protein
MRGELRRLRDHLKDDEHLRALAGGVSEGSDGLVVVTGDRLFFFDASDEGDSEISFPWDEVASVEFRDQRIKLARVHDSAREGKLSGLRRFLADTPLTLELYVSDSADLSRLYEALVGHDGPLKDRALSFDDPPPPPVERRARPAPSPALDSPRIEALRRWSALAWSDVRSGSLPLIYAGGAIALATIVGAGLGISETTSGGTTTCSWHASGWLLPPVLVGPPVAMLLVVLGTRRARHEELAWQGWLAGWGVILVALAIYSSSLWVLSGRELC